MWAHLDEGYIWYSMNRVPNAETVRMFPDQYITLPDRLAKRLKKAHDEMNKVQDAIDELRDKRGGS